MRETEALEAAGQPEVPEPAPDTDAEDWRTRLDGVLAGVQERARERAAHSREKALKPFEKDERKGSAWSRAWSSYAKSQMSRSPSGLGGDDTYLARAADRVQRSLHSKTQREREQGDRSWGMLRELKDPNLVTDIATAGFAELGESRLAVRALEKAGRGEPLTDTEQDMIEVLRAAGEVEDYLASQGGRTRGAVVGSTVAKSLPYMAGFGYTSGIGKAAAAAAVKNTGRGMVRKAVDKAAKTGVSALAMTPFQSGLYKSYDERTADQYTIGEREVEKSDPAARIERMYKAGAETFTEVLTEQMGEALGSGVRWLLKKPVEGIAKMTGRRLAFPGYGRDAYLDGLRERMLWNGPVNEWLEEVAGGIMSPLLTGETEKWKENLSGDNLWNTFLSTSVMGAGFSALEIPSAARYGRRLASLYRAERDALGGIENPGLREAVFRAMRRPTVEEQAKAMAGIDWKAEDVSALDAARAADYARRKIDRTMFQGIVREQETAEKFRRLQEFTVKARYGGPDGTVQTGEFVVAYDAEGVPYLVGAGRLDGAAETLRVVDREGNLRDMPYAEVAKIDRMTVNDFLQTEYARSFGQEGNEAGATEATSRQLPGFQEAGRETDAEREEYDRFDREAAEEAGIEPEVVEQEVPGGWPRYGNGERVILADGSRGTVASPEAGGYVVELEDGRFRVAKYRDIAEREPVSENEPVRETETEDRNGERETGVPAIPEVLSEASEDRTETGKPGRVKTRKIRSNVSPYAERAEALGDYVSIEDVILRDIASGLKFRWNDEGNSRGLASELGLTGKEGERRTRIQILGKEGITPERYAERLYFEYGAGNESGSGVSWPLDDLEIKDAVLGILSRIATPRQAYEEAVSLRGEDVRQSEVSQEEIADMERYEQERIRIREELLQDAAFTEWIDGIGPEDVSEIEKMFAEHADIYHENNKFEPSAPQKAAESTGKTVENDPLRQNNDREGEKPADTPDGGDRGDAGGGEQGNAQADHGPDRREPERGARPAGYAGGRLGEVRPLNSQEQKAVDETLAGIDTRLEQLRASLNGKKAELAAEKRKIGAAYSEDNQASLFGGETPAAMPGSLFDVPRDLFRQNLSGIVASLQAEIDRIGAEITRLYDSREKAAADAVKAMRTQGTLWMEDAGTVEDSAAGGAEAAGETEAKAQAEAVREDKRADETGRETTAGDGQAGDAGQRLENVADKSDPAALLEGVENDIPPETATRAFSWSSMDPERRGAGVVEAYTEYIKQVYDRTLPLAGTPRQKEVFAEAFAWFRERTRRLYLDWLAAHSRVASPMVTGPAKFDYARNEKRNRTEHNRLEALIAWQQTAQEKIQARIEAARTPEQIDTANRKAAEKEAFRYLRDAVRTFGDPVFSILDNPLIKQGFVRDVLRVAKKDVATAQKMVADLNAAGMKFAGKPVLTPRHGIHKQLEELRARQTAPPQPEQEAGRPSERTAELSAAEKIRHTKTGADLYRVQLAGRVDADRFGELRAGAKAHGGYYSKFSRGFLFDTEEQAEAFRTEYAGSGGSENNDYISGTERPAGVEAGPQTSNDHEPDRPGDLQPDRGGVSAPDSDHAEIVPHDDGPDGRGRGNRAREAGANGTGTVRSHNDRSGRDQAVGAGGVAGAGLSAGARSDWSLQDEAPGTLSVPAGSIDTGGGYDAGRRGTDAVGKRAPADPQTAASGTGGGTSPDLNPTRPDVPQAKREAQRRAETLPVEVGSIDNIRETLPYLLPEQHDDVLKAETQFFDPSHDVRETAFGKGMMFTNGTGTGKTYTGLGIIKRFVKRGKTEILIVVPSQTKVTDWIDDAQNLGLDLVPLASVRDAGAGLNITTYANFGMNEALKGRTFDLVVYDECHRLMESQGGDPSERTYKHYTITNKDDDTAYRRLLALEPAYIRRTEVREKIAPSEKELSRYRENPDLYEKEIARLEGELAPLRAEEKALTEALDAKEPQLQEAAREAAARTKVLFLSATPFKSRYSLAYAESYLFKYPEVERNGYNTPGPEEAFYMEHFGAAYRMRYNRLENHVEDAGLVAKQEVAFSELLKERGVLSGRMISSDMDYSRDFPAVTGFNAGTFNRALTEVYDSENDFSELRQDFGEVFHDYNYSTQLFEVLKASAAAERIGRHLALGRKLVIFHRRKQGGVRPPFALALAKARKRAKQLPEYKREERNKILTQAKRFEAKYGELLAYEQTLDYRPVQEQLKDRYGDRAALFNGDTTTREKNRAVRRFNTDGSGLDMIVIQEESGKEGISLHDTTGKHQRVLMSLALPVSSITALQIEGRIYRIGNRTDAIFEYPLLGLDSEVRHFGENINRKLSTTENLAMGGLARDLLHSFAEGVLESTGEVDVTVQGKGGKERDKARTAGVVTDSYERAIMDYYGTLRKTSRNKSQEGADYFATPEPLGFKMVEWADGQAGDEYLEPSAGHGAIARYVPQTGSLTAIEPSTELHAKLTLRAGGGVRKIVQGTFEELSPWANKYDVIVMNPPFGTNSKTAAEHVGKAYCHLRKYGRIVAIVPNGPSMQKRIDRMMEDTKEFSDLVLRAEILLPSCTFERAGTSVSAKVIVLDRCPGADYSGIQTTDLRRVETVKELFAELRDLEVRPRERRPQEDAARYREKRDAGTEGQAKRSEKIEEAVRQLAGELGADVAVVRDKAEIAGPFASRRRGAQGWYEPETGKVVLVLPNLRSVAEAEATVLHEIVGHKGLRGMLGRRFVPFIDGVYEGMDEAGRAQVEAEMRRQAARQRRNGGKEPEREEARRLAVEEILAEAAEGDVTPGRLARIMGRVRRMLREVLGIPLRINDRDVAYMLWRARRQVRKGKNAADSVRDKADERRIRTVLFGKRRVRKAPKPRTDSYEWAGDFVRDMARYREERGLIRLGKKGPTAIFDKRSVKQQAERLLIDNALPVRRLQEEIVRRDGKVEEMTDVYKHLNHYPSVAKAAIERYRRDYMEPVLDGIAAIARQTGMDEGRIIDYITAESTLERHESGQFSVSEKEDDAWNIRKVREIIDRFKRDFYGSRREWLEREGAKALTDAERSRLAPETAAALERRGRAGLTDAQRQAVDDLPLRILWERINAANDRVLDILVEDGMLTGETKKRIQGHGWKYYVPLMGWDFRMLDEDGNPVIFNPADVYDFSGEYRQDFHLRQVVKEAEVRTRKPSNPVAQMMSIGTAAILAAKKNRVNQRVLWLVKNNPAKHLYRENRIWYAKGPDGGWIPTTVEPSLEEVQQSEAARREIARLEKEAREAIREWDSERAARLWVKIQEVETLNIVSSTAYPEKNFGREAPVSYPFDQRRCVECYVAGVKHVVTFADPAVAAAINGFNNVKIARWLDNTVGDATRWLARAFTSRNPAFVATNFLRDVQHAALVHAIDRDGTFGGFVRNIRPGMAAITRNVRGKARPLTVRETGALDVLDPSERAELVRQFGAARVADTLYDYFVEYGGETGFVHGKSVEEAERELRRYVAFRTGETGRLFREAGRSEKPGIALAYAGRQLKLDAVARGFDNASKVAENTSRFATFLASLNAGRSLLRAVDDAKNVTVNFNRRGTASRALGMFYVFFNASVQGAAQVGRVAWRNRKRFRQAVALMTAGGFLNSLLLDLFLGGMDDGEGPYVLSDYERQNHLVIPWIGRRGYVKIPLPQGFRAFHGIGVLLHDLYKGKLTAEECARDVLALLYADFSPVASPSPDGDFGRVLVPTAATPFYDIAVNEDAFGYPVGKAAYTDNYPLSEMGLRNVNKAIYHICRGVNRLGGGTEQIPAGMRNDGRIDPLLRGIFEWNPSHVEHVLTYYGGGMGKFARDFIHTTQAVMGLDEELNTYDLPIINRLYGTARPERPAARFYAERDRLENLAAKYKRMGREIDMDDPDVRRDLERIETFMEYNRAVSRILELLKQADFGMEEYDRLREELDRVMREYLKRAEHEAGD